MDFDTITLSTELLDGIGRTVYDVNYLVVESTGKCSKYAQCGQRLGSCLKTW